MSERWAYFWAALQAGDVEAVREHALAGAALAVSGIAGWCPGYHQTGVTSMDGPGDRPDEAGRGSWLRGRVPTVVAADGVREPAS